MKQQFIRDFLLAFALAAPLAAQEAAQPALTGDLAWQPAALEARTETALPASTDPDPVAADQMATEPATEDVKPERMDVLLERVFEVLVELKRLSERVVAMETLLAKNSTLIAHICPFSDPGACASAMAAVPHLAQELSNLRYEVEQIHPQVTTARPGQSGSVPEADVPTPETAPESFEFFDLPGQANTLEPAAGAHQPITPMTRGSQGTDAEPFVLARLQDGTPDWRAPRELGELLTRLPDRDQCAEAGRWFAETVEDRYENQFLVRDGDIIRRCALTSNGAWQVFSTIPGDSGHVVIKGGS